MVRSLPSLCRARLPFPNQQPIVTHVKSALHCNDAPSGKRLINIYRSCKQPNTKLGQIIIARLRENRPIRPAPYWSQIVARRPRRRISEHCFVWTQAIQTYIPSDSAGLKEEEAPRRASGPKEDTSY